MQTLQQYIKIFCFTILCCVVIPASANPPPSPGMPKNMAQLQAAMQCIQGIDKSALKNLEQKSKNAKAEVDGLCRDGKRDKAQSKALSFAKDMMRNPAIQQMVVCRDMAKGMIPELPFEKFEENAKAEHVCDDLIKN